MKKDAGRWWSIGRKAAGVALVIIGILALLTPFTPGSWLIFVGAQMLGFELLFLKKLRARLRDRKRKREP
jgi:hypothetical protein